ncbi:MAG TPA: hypothetical protein VH164_02385 [Ktedonobacteraceae bacterium]|nr:hypothetical protein [Ktedonobacteraceae bacterium]
MRRKKTRFLSEGPEILGFLLDPVEGAADEAEARASLRPPAA